MYDDKFLDLKNSFIESVKDNFNKIEIKINSPVFDVNLPEHLKYGGGIEIWKSRVNNIV
jgi:hypothetical protein